MTQTTPPGWYHGEGDPVGTNRWWDGSQWIGEPQMQGPSVASGPAARAAVDEFAAKLGDNTASAIRRLIGRIIDFLLVLIPTVAVALSRFDLSGIGDAFEDFSDAEPGDTAAQTEFQNELTAIIENGIEGIAPLMMAVLLGIWALEVLLLKQVGATPGKFVTGTRIRSAEDGAALSWLQAMLRPSLRLLSVFGYVVVALSSLLALVAFCISAVSLVMIFAVDRKQTLMDKIAKTVVNRA